MQEQRAGIEADRPETATPDVVIATVPFDRPWQWLAAGWRDLWTAPGIAISYGLLAAGGGAMLALVLAVRGHGALLPVLAGGFALVGPVLAVGLYETSRLIAAGRTPRLADTWRAAFGSLGRLGLLAAFLLFVYLVWIRIAFMLLALFLGTHGLPPVREIMPTLLFTPHGLGLLVVGTAVGGLLAAIVFATTAVSLPLLVERRVDVATAMGRSIEACLVNPRPMTLWAALIAGFVLVGIATLGAGLVLIFPLLGHATWHACRDLVKREAGG